VSGDENGSGSATSGDGATSDGDGSDSPSTAEKAVTVLSVVFTVFLFAFLVWHALQVPADATPRADIERVEELPGDRVGVTVLLTNPGSEGLLSATVAVNCTQPAPSAEFTHVPTDGRRSAVLVCPAGTGRNATANVTMWQTA
jgi:hypothetical protein